ncbi:hypothetical protein GCM10020254_86860 [Streptomyces goshikiensis]
MAGLGLLQRAEFAQRPELVGADCDLHRFAQLGFPGGGGRGVGGELGLDDDADVQAVDGARRRRGEQLCDALPLRELRRATEVVGQVLVPGRLPRVEPRLFEGRRDYARVHASRLPPYDAAADAGRVDRLAGRGDAWGADGGRCAGAARAWSSSASQSWSGQGAGRRQSVVGDPPN